MVSTTTILKLILVTAILAMLTALLGLYNTIRIIQVDTGTRSVLTEQASFNNKVIQLLSK